MPKILSVTTNSNPIPVGLAAEKAPQGFLGRKQERALVLDWQTGANDAARDALVRKFLPLIRKIARRFNYETLPLDDRIQLGCIGFLRSLDKFDLGKDIRLSTYAEYWISAEIREATERSRSVVVRGAGHKAVCADRLFGLDASNLIDASARRSHERAPDLFRPPNSNHKGNGGSQDKLPARDEYENGESDEFDGRCKPLIDSLKSLNDRERHVIKTRWLADIPATLATIAKRFDVSRERARQIEERTLEKLKSDIEVARPYGFAQGMTLSAFSVRGGGLSRSFVLERIYLERALRLELAWGGL